MREYKKTDAYRKKAAAYARKKRAEDPERMRANEKAWREKNVEKVQEKNRRRSKRLGKMGRRDYQLQQLYGITHEDYERMLEEQKGKCAICGTDKPRRKGRLYFSVDHCHDTGKVRGLLCDFCNNGIGRLNDDPALLRKAIEYLERTG